MDLIRLWLHESSRVYGDKMIEDKDMENFRKLKDEIAHQSFDVSKVAFKNSVHALIFDTSIFLLYRIWTRRLYRLSL